MLRARFDRLFSRRTGYVPLNRLLARLHPRKAKLLRVLERPEILLHTNGSENDIRPCVTKRNVSGGTMSEGGRTARDVLLGLMKTCHKLGLSFYRFLGDRLRVLPRNLPNYQVAVITYWNCYIFFWSGTQASTIPSSPVVAGARILFMLAASALPAFAALSVRPGTYRFI